MPWSLFLPCRAWVSILFTPVSNRDYTLVIGITAHSVVLILLNMATELLYGAVNPKLRST
ncbi:MAG: hypothetical protein R2857_11875 [Vampirovibrionales bacterium]